MGAAEPSGTNSLVGTQAVGDRFLSVNCWDFSHENISDTDKNVLSVLLIKEI